MKYTDLFLIFIFVFMAVSLSAEEKKKLYRWVDEHGNTHFSDVPVKGAEAFDMKEVPTTKMQKVILPPPPSSSSTSSNQGAGSTSNPSAAKSHPGYESLLFSSPENEGVIRNNSGSVPLVASVTPSLGEGHKIQFFLDGNALVAESGTSVTFNEVEYGDHQAKFVVLDENGNPVAESETIGFTLLNNIPARKNR